MGRFVQDLLLWSTAEFDYVRLGDGFVQGSSIMPQKRNPVALEHARVIGSKAVGQAQAVMTAVHNTPFGDINDTEDDLQPLVFSMFKDAFRAVSIVGCGPSHRRVRRATARSTRRRRLDDADRTGRYARARTGHSVQRRPRNLGALRCGACAGSGQAAGSDSRRRSRPRCFPRRSVYTEGALEQILSPRHFVDGSADLRRSAPEETRAGRRCINAEFDADQAWLDEATAALARRTAPR